VPHLNKSLADLRKPLLPGVSHRDSNCKLARFFSQVTKSINLLSGISSSNALLTKPC